MAQRILALELVGDRVRAAVAERSWNSFTLAGVYDKVRADDEADLSGALSRLMVGGRPARHRHLGAARGSRRQAHPRTAIQGCAPAASGRSVRTRRASAVPGRQWRVAFARVGREGDHTLVMAAMVRKTDLQQHLDLLQKAGLDPKTVTLAPLALAAMFTRAKNGNGAKPMAHLVVEGDESSTSVVLVDLAGTPRAMRSMRRRPDDVRRLAGRAGRGRADSQLGASDPACAAVRKPIRPR